MTLLPRMKLCEREEQHYARADAVLAFVVDDALLVGMTQNSDALLFNNVCGGAAYSD